MSLGQDPVMHASGLGPVEALPIDPGAIPRQQGLIGWCRSRWGAGGPSPPRAGPPTSAHHLYGHEATNRWDPDAVKVFWKDQWIGCIRRDMAALIAAIEALVCNSGVECCQLPPGSRQAMGTHWLVLELPLPVAEAGGLAEQQPGHHPAQQQRQVTLVAGGAVLTEETGQISMEPGGEVQEGSVWSETPGSRGSPPSQSPETDCGATAAAFVSASRARPTSNRPWHHGPAAGSAPPCHALSPIAVSPGSAF